MRCRKYHAVFCWTPSSFDKLQATDPLASGQHVVERDDPQAGVQLGRVHDRARLDGEVGAAGMAPVGVFGI